MKLSAVLGSVALLCVGGNAVANDFPTSARVEFVLSCMDKKGGQNYDTLYPCICQIDHIANDMPYKRFEFAQTMAVMINTPGERGGQFRDAPGARGLIKEYKQLLADSEQQCNVKNVSAR